MNLLPMFAARCYASVAYAIMRCLSVCVCLFVCVEFYLYPTVGTVLIHSVKPELTE